MRYWDASVFKEVETNSGPNLFTISEWVSMYNDEEDVPDYMKELMINSFIKDPDRGFVVSAFEVDNDY